MKKKVVSFPKTKNLSDAIQDIIGDDISFADEENDRIISLLIEKLKVADTSLQLKILFVLGSLEAAEALETLYEMIHTEEHSEAVRSMAATQIKVICAKKKILAHFRNKLIDDLRSSDAFIRASAVNALGWKRNVIAIGPLIERLRDEKWEVRRATISALCNIGDKRSLEIIGASVISRGSDSKKAFLTDLETLNSARITPLLPSIERLLYDEDPEVKEVATRLYDKFQNSSVGLVPR